ncbi:MAG: GTP-binding protein [Actinomycetota bacterium]
MSSLPTLRIATAGSVDDGKSTLIGRLLHDTKTVFEDQLAAVTRASRRYGDGEVNLALLTDGLRAEREQGITIDVAYRYFATPQRNFIVADTPGHQQYTRNMVTGASTADVAIVLVDARHGIVEQTRRHAFIASLLGVRAIALAVNKMDLVEWDQGVFEVIVKEATAYVEGLPDPVAVTAFPISALDGDNVVDRSDRAPWYAGPALLSWLEQFDADASVDGQGSARLDVQRVLRPQGSDYRGYAGRLADGPLAVGDAVTVLPSGRRSTVVGLQRHGAAVESAVPGHAVAVELADDVDIARGDVLMAGDHRVKVTEAVEGMLCWMIDTPLRAGTRLWFKHGTRTGRAIVDEVVHVHDVASASTVAADEVGLNDLAVVRLALSEPIAAVPYRTSHEGGRMILIDEATNVTAGALLLSESVPAR